MAFCYFGICHYLLAILFISISCRNPPCPHPKIITTTNKSCLICFLSENLRIFFVFWKTIKFSDPMLYISYGNWWWFVFSFLFQWYKIFDRTKQKGSLCSQMYPGIKMCSVQGHVCWCFSEERHCRERCAINFVWYVSRYIPGYARVHIYKLCYSYTKNCKYKQVHSDRAFFLSILQHPLKRITCRWAAPFFLIFRQML